jgi:hypothetical protein
MSTGIPMRIVKYTIAFLRNPLAHGLILCFSAVLLVGLVLLRSRISLLSQLKAGFNHRKQDLKLLQHEKKLSAFLLKEKSAWPLILQRKVTVSHSNPDTKLKLMATLQKENIKINSMALDKKNKTKLLYDLKLTGNFDSFENWLKSGPSAPPYPMIKSLKLSSLDQKDSIAVEMKVWL